MIGVRWGEWSGSAKWLVVMGIGLLFVWVYPSIGRPGSGSNQPSGDSKVLIDFQKPDKDGFPQGWQAQRSISTAQKTYQVQREESLAFLHAKDASQRVYTKEIDWDPKAYPVLTWRWRVKAIPKNAEFVAAIYPSLDVDLMFIPVNTKYVWSVQKPVGAITEGGMFGATEMVIRNGRQPVGEWMEERVNVYQDFKQIHHHEPATKAWGISLLAGPGVEVDFGSFEVHHR